MSLGDILNDIWSILNDVNVVEFFWIFHVEIKNQKVDRLSTCVVESNVDLDYHKIYTLKMKFSASTSFEPNFIKILT